MTNTAEPSSWSVDRDTDGHRVYKLVWKVTMDLDSDGPFDVLTFAPIAQIGDPWTYGNTNDPWAFCTPIARAWLRDQKAGEPCRYWWVEQAFSTKQNSKRCQDTTIEDPLLEPQRISGSFAKYTKEVTKDRFGNPIHNSAFELLRGPQLEFDFNRPQVTIEQNVIDLQLALFSSMVDTVNDATLWGLGARRIKLSNVGWERKIYGVCNYYYTRRFDFDIDYETFDRTVLDEGTKALNGRWNQENGHWQLVNIGGSPPNPQNPNHFSRYLDRAGNPTRVILDGSGVPAASVVESGSGTGTGTGESGPAGEIDIDFYPESNFLLLGIPTSL